MEVLLYITHIKNWVGKNENIHLFVRLRWKF